MQHDLLVAAKEARDVCAIACRLIVENGLMSQFANALERSGFQDGFGTRLQAAISEKEMMMHDGFQGDLRDWFAGLAMQGMLADTNEAPEHGESKETWQEEISCQAFLIADAMLAVRDEGKPDYVKASLKGGHDDPELPY